MTDEIQIKDTTERFAMSKSRLEDRARPYTPKEIAKLQKEVDLYAANFVLMDPYRVQASVEDAALRGMEHQREYDAEDRKRERFVLNIGLCICMISAIILLFVVYEPSNLPPADLFK